jgi:hypothetical protein
MPGTCEQAPSTQKPEQSLSAVQLIREQVPALQAKFGRQSVSPVHVGATQWPAWQVMAALLPSSLPPLHSSSVVHPDTQR